MKKLLILFLFLTVSARLYADNEGHLALQEVYVFNHETADYKSNLTIDEFKNGAITKWSKKLILL